MPKFLVGTAIAGFAVATVAVGTPAAVAAPPQGAALQAAPASGREICRYMVTADWLRYHTSPGVNTPAPGQWPYGTIVYAFKAGTVVKDGYTWRKTEGNYWAATMYLSYQGGCQLDQ